MSTILEVKDLKKYFPIRGTSVRPGKHVVRAVDGIDLTLEEGETLGLVGESGCGKSTAGKCILRLIKPTSGQVLLRGEDILRKSRSEMRKVRSEMQIIFQDPFASLNPRMTVGQTVEESVKINLKLGKKERLDKVTRLLQDVGLGAEDYNKYPHEFSGGQRQRVGIARALAVHPKIIIADEPVSALDVSIRAQVLNLLQELKERYKLTYLFVSHDLSVVEYLCDRIAVMYLGKIMELADRDDLYGSPLHPYSRALLSAVPIPDPTVKRKRVPLTGEIPSASNPPPGCLFHTRCPERFEPCDKIEPPLVVKQGNRFVRCLLYGGV
ncbi:MAG: ATP-binding cassette domain-containing protein [bacterium]|nr:ATP-binding cassette domain-containing protein [bacterium]